MNKNTVNRRHFLKMSATVAGIVLAPEMAASTDGKKGLPRRTLGKTGIQLPVLSMGVSSNHLPVLRAAYHSGVIHFDTANGYQNGRTEEMLGDFFAGKPRDSFILSTKIYEKDRQRLAQGFAEKFETSMKRLKTDYVDILYYHDVRTVEEVNCQPVLDVMLKLKKEGRVRYIGVSTHSNEAEVIHTMLDNGNYDVALAAYNFNQHHSSQLDAAFERAVKAGMGIIGMKAMAGGFLDKEHTQKINGKAALKWVLQNPQITTVLAGYTSFDELDECLEASTDSQLTEKEKEYLAAVNRRTLLYCRGCRSCTAQCPQRLPIPDLMRAYMYHYGYKNPAMAHETVMGLSLPDHPCGQCTECTVTCTAGFRVAEKIKDIARIRKEPGEFMV
ncbi:MAG: aldo/keto reductase [Bacteroidales bacterium]|jgi:predicted aldo/keto reductase-like oxidoreductase|nr:aldo/keto reductase [Bacteroidales bacterium]